MEEDELFTALEKVQAYLIVVEGKKDEKALQELGFEYVFVLNEDGKSLYEKIEEIEVLASGKKVCILTDFDKKGKQLYLLLKKELSTKKVKMDNTLRSILLKNHVSHIEGLASFLRTSGKTMGS